MRDFPSIETVYQKFKACKGIATDTRQDLTGRMFFALRGEHFDGNSFAYEAIAHGASWVIADDDSLGFHEQLILVEDSLKTLQELARCHRTKLTVPVIAITGSNGKTTTKELMCRVLGSVYNVFASPGNFNNHIGLPVSLLSVTADAEIVVLELGANHILEHEFLLGIARPTAGIVTNIGKDHLGEFGGMTGVSEAYREVTDYFVNEKQTVFFLNKDDDIVDRLMIRKDVISYGRKRKYASPDFTAEITTASYFAGLKIESGLAQFKDLNVDIRSRLFGKFNAYNILAAAAVGCHFGIPPDKIREAVESYVPSNNRSQVVEKDSNVYIFDAYNANPSSMTLAVESFLEFPYANKVLILGEMHELGQASIVEHGLLVEYIRELGFKTVILVGPGFDVYANVYGHRYFKDSKQLGLWLKGKKWKNTAFLVKGSRGVKLENAFDFFGK